MTNWLLPGLLGLTFVGAALAPMVVRRVRHGAIALALPCLLGFILLLTTLPEIAQGKALESRVSWAPSLGVNLSLRLDGWSLLFALLIVGVGALVLIYAAFYLRDHPLRHRFFALLIFFMGAMLGVALAQNLIALWVFWELTSVSSYLLIGFEQERRAARVAALKALLVTGSGGLILLAGLLLIGRIAGSFELPEILARADLLRADPLYPVVAVCVLIGAFTKSAQWPFHFWLPAAMEAPTPVSAYLHSATMVKAGIYLLGRLNPALGQTPLWNNTLLIIGGITVLVGALLCLAQTDMKRILAYTTISALGVMVLLLGAAAGSAAAGRVAAGALVAFLLAHALYKGALFLLAGAIDHEAKTRDVRILRGLAGRMPRTRVITLAAAAGLAGLPLTFAFIAKESALETLLTPGAAGAAAVLVVASAAYVAAAILLAVRPFQGEISSDFAAVHDAPPGLLLGPAVLTLGSLTLGLLPFLVQPLLRAAAAAVTGADLPDLNLMLWHGLSLPLLLSAAAWLAGFLAIWAKLDERARAVTDRLPRLAGDTAYHGALSLLNRTARTVTGALQNGQLRLYILTIVVTTVLLTIGTLLQSGQPLPLARWDGIYFYEAVVCGLLIAGALAAVLIRNRLGAVAALGVVGYGVALLYILFGAPDLAMTQFLIETLTVLLYVFVFYHLPRYSILSRKSARTRDILVSVGFGAMVTLLLLAVSASPLQPALTGFFAGNSVPGGHGRNVVNVILVDFRGFDTLGEITVLSLAALGVFALVRLRLRRSASAVSVNPESSS